MIALAAENGFPHWATLGAIYRGEALAEQGQAGGISQMRQGMVALRESGAEQLQSYLLGRLAEAFGIDGQVEKGLATLVEALDFVGKTRECYYEAELYRLQGELSLQIHSRRHADGIQKGAEASFRKALSIARRQEAKSLELRAATSLARLWQGQGQVVEARELLAPVYEWFTEGFDTKDLQEAKVLLEELQ